jgi:hypothetical protein
MIKKLIYMKFLSILFSICKIDNDVKIIFDYIFTRLFDQLLLPPPHETQPLSQQT